MKFCNFSAVSVHNEKKEKPKFTTKPRAVEEPKVKKTRTKAVEQTEKTE